jgi:hypothetical protein
MYHINSLKHTRTVFLTKNLTLLSVCLFIRYDCYKDENENEALLQNRLGITEVLGRETHPSANIFTSNPHINFTKMPQTKRLNYGKALKHKFVSITDV